MKHLLLLLLVSSSLFAQKESQTFCKGGKTGSYFPLSIQHKKIRWYGGFYNETLAGEKKTGGKTYHELAQNWPDRDTDHILLREEKGKVFQYDPETGQDLLRYDPSLGINASWHILDRKYTIVRYDGQLETPFCDYRNLLVIRAEFESVTYSFYYQQGLGYIGATEDSQLVSYLMPDRS